jgi:hypothetical protein
LVSNKLNKELNDNKETFQKETNALIKDFKIQIKSWKEDLGEKKREKLAVEKQRSVSKKSNNSQTESNYDIPYSVKMLLPPIFNSNLCHLTSKINFLSNSLPNLDTILWVEPDTTHQDEAEEALNNQYDRQIDDFYRTEQERIKAQREVMTNQNLVHHIEREKNLEYYRI